MSNERQTVRNKLGVALATVGGVALVIVAVVAVGFVAQHIGSSGSLSSVNAGAFAANQRELATTLGLSGQSPGTATANIVDIQNFVNKLLNGLDSLVAAQKPIFIFDKDAPRQLLQAVQNITLFAIVIERSVEVYLRLTNQNGPNRFDPPAPGDAPPEASGPAARAGLALGLLVSLAGVRILGALGAPPGGAIASLLWNGVDVVVTAGLLAGGSFVMHEVTEQITGLINLIPGPNQTQAAANVTASATQPGADQQNPAKPDPIAKRIVDACSSGFVTKQSDNFGFANGVAVWVNAKFPAATNADDLIAAMPARGWTKLPTTDAARSAAETGQFVVALCPSSAIPGGGPGFVAIVVPDTAARSIAPTAYWGSCGVIASGNRLPLDKASGGLPVAQLLYFSTDIT